MEKKLLTTREAAAYIGFAEQTLVNWRFQGNKNLPYVKLGPKSLRYRIEDLDEFLRGEYVPASNPA